MNYRDFLKDIKQADLELLAWYDEDSLKDMKIQFRTLNKALENNILIYVEKDDIYISPKTYAVKYAIGEDVQKPGECKSETNANEKGMEQIGKGMFSTVYKAANNKVLIKSRDDVKECMSLGWFPESSLFPLIEYVGQSDDCEWRYYEEKFYRKVKSIKNNLTKSEWEFYQILRGLTSLYKPNNDRFIHWHKQFDRIPNKFHVKRLALKEALDGLANYGLDIAFEISPRNIAIDKKRLVLLDCFFFTSAMNKR